MLSLVKMLTFPKYLGDKVGIGFHLNNSINMEETSKMERFIWYVLFADFLSALPFFSSSVSSFLADIMARHSEATLRG